MSQCLAKYYVCTEISMTKKASFVFKYIIAFFAGILVYVCEYKLYIWNYVIGFGQVKAFFVVIHTFVIVAYNLARKRDPKLFKEPCSIT